MKPGFTLLEIILATALAGMISTALIFMLQQMNGTLMRVDKVSDLDMRAAMLQNQMERDISGAFAPADFSVTNTNGQTTEEGPKKIEKIFWGGNTLEEALTFITNNPLQTYWGERSGKPQPKIVRVVYRLIPDPKYKDVYTLMRQEGSDLSISAEALPDKSYAMIEGIRSINIQYTTLIKQEKPQEERAPKKAGEKTTAQPAQTEKDEPEEKQTQAAEEFERKVVQEWKANTEDQKPPWPLIPQFITMQVSLWDNTFKHSTPFTFEFQILPRFEKADQKAEQEKETQKFGWSSLLGNPT